MMIPQLLIPVIYGIGENRFMHEQGEMMIMEHFKPYHLWLSIILFLNAASANSFLEGLFIFVWTPLALDVTWWLIRYWESHVWLDKADWDNYLGYPLICGCYWWWWVCGIACVVLGAIII